MAEPAPLSEFTDALGYEFSNVDLLELALTHRSFCAENGNVESNERLEFLGDAVLGLAVAEHLFTSRPDQAEGHLAKARADVVSATSLARAAEAADVGRFLRLGKGEENSGGRSKVSILADAMEALIAAVYIDSGWEAARDLINRHLTEVGANSMPGFGDYKSRLQERAAALSLEAPRYEVTSTGPDHDRVFNATVEVGSSTGSGQGSSKKQAQQQAAQSALRELDANTEEQLDRTEHGSGQSAQQPATVPCGGSQ